MNVNEILKKTQAGEVLSLDELIYLLGLLPDSPETYRVMAEANRVSKELSGGQAEVHAQFSLNLAPCNCECLFCSFAKTNRIFNTRTELSVEQAIAYARNFEKEGANAILFMTTAQYPLEKFLEITKEVKGHLKPDTTLIANVGDQSLKNALKLKEIGFTGVYHSLRLREGIDTGITAERRKQSIFNFKDAGLEVGTCVEPIGPEHTNQELAEMIRFAGSFNASYSGAARRISIPSTKIAQRGMITELRMAQIVAITRLGTSHDIIGNCTHEPCTLGAVSGANLFWAEAGANPRDIEAHTEKNRGGTVNRCRSIFRESNWDVRHGPSRYYNRAYQGT